MADLQALVRAQRWWSSKVLPVLAAGSVSALAADTSPDDGLLRFAAMVVSAAGLGAWAHVLNDWCDLEGDRLASKPNALSGLAPQARAGLAASALVVGIAPWTILRPAPVVSLLVVALIVLPMLYSIPPVRLKGRAAAGVAADAAQAHIVPTLVALFLLRDAADPGRDWWLALAASLVWAAGFGVRAILVHQLRDELNDRAARVRTFVVRHGAVRAVVIGRRAFILELTGVTALLVASVILAPWAAVFFVAYLFLWVLALRWDHRPFDPVPRQAEWLPLAEFYEVWPALLFAGSLCAADPGWWPLPAAIVLLFTGAVAKQVVSLGALLRSAAHDTRLVGRAIVRRAGMGWRAAEGGAVTAGWRVRSAAARLGALANAAVWRLRDIPWRLRVLWYDGWVGRARYAAIRWGIALWLFARRQGRRFRRIVLRRTPPHSMV